MLFDGFIEQHALKTASETGTIYRGLKVELGIDNSAKLFHALIDHNLQKVAEMVLDLATDGRDAGWHWSLKFEGAERFAESSSDHTVGINFSYWYLPIIMEGQYLSSDVEYRQDHLEDGMVSGYTWEGKEEWEVPIRQGAPISVEAVSVFAPDDLEWALSIYEGEGDAPEALSLPGKWIRIPISRTVTAAKTLDKMAHTAAWTDVQSKAKRIYDEGGVRIISVTGPYIAAHVRGESGEYESTLERGSNHEILQWTCTCPWFAYSFGRSGRWKKYEGRMCVTPDTMIAMADGSFKRIDEVELGDCVVTHDGIGAVTQLIVNDYEGPLQSIKSAGYALPLRITPNHEAWAYGAPQRLFKSWQDTKGQGFKFYDESFMLDSDPAWIDAGDLKVHDWMTGPILPTSHRNYFDVSALLDELGVDYEIEDGRIYTVHTKGRHSGSLPVHLAPSDPIMDVVGIYLAEGNFDAKRSEVQWTIHEDEENTYGKLLQSALDALGAGTLRVYRRPEVTKGISLRVTNRPLALVLNHLAGTGSRSKQLHPWIMTLAADLQERMFDAYWVGDGHESGTRRAISTTSDLLAQQIHALLLRCGYLPSWSVAKNNGGPLGRSKELTINKVAYVPDRQFANGQRANGEGYYSAKINEIEEVQYKGQVYNLKVDGQESYVANGRIVHNCSHALATQYKAQSEGMFGREINEQAEAPEWDKGDITYYTAPPQKAWRSSKTAMATSEAEELANSLIDHWLGDVSYGSWTFKWNRQTSAFGETSYRDKTISLSKPLCEVNSIEEIRDTILHEIAHALAGPGAGHGPEWKEWAIKVGAKPEAKSGDDTVSAPPKVVGVCPNCGAESYRQRMPKDVTMWACAKPECKAAVPFEQRTFQWSRIPKKASKCAELNNSVVPLYSVANPLPGEGIARQYAIAPSDSDFLGSEIAVISKAYRDMPVLDRAAVGLWERLGGIVRERAEVLKQTWEIQVLDIDPYATADEMHADLQKQIYKVTTLHSHHPVWDVDTNVAFRITHDIEGHGRANSDFSFHGEVLAYQAQCDTIPADLWGVLFTEVVAQSAYANIHHLFGEQKVGLINLTPQEAMTLVGEVTDAPDPQYDALHFSAAKTAADDHVDPHSGIMIAVRPPEAVCEALLLDGGSEPLDQLHVTLVYIPAEFETDLDLLRQVVMAEAALSDPAEGIYGGYGRFETPDGPVTVALVDSEELQVLQHHLVKALERAGIEISHKHGFTPHTTLNYGEIDFPDLPSVARTTFVFDQFIISPPNGIWERYDIGGPLSVEADFMGLPTEDPEGDFPDEEIPEGGVEAEIHDEPEGALPFTDGGVEGEEEELADGEARDLDPTTAALQQGLSWLMDGNSPQGEKRDDEMNLAKAATDYLTTSTAVKTFTYAEQQAIINEGEGVTASNLDRLRLEGTHYEALEEQMARADEIGEAVLWW